MVDALLVAKIVLISFIVISPLLSYKAVTFLDITGIKIMILISIVLISFIDLELAILSTIAFLVLLINLYNINCKALRQIHEQKVVPAESKVFKAVVAEVGSEMSQIPPSAENSVPFVATELAQIIPTPSGTKNIITEYQTVMTMPKAYCSASTELYDIVSDNLYEHNIDAKIKPYEAYIKQLSPNESLKLIQTNELI